MRSGKDIKEQYKKQFESISWIRNITMNQNYHKRLGGYLSEPKLGLRKASSEHSYITAAKAKYLNNSKHINYRYNPNFHNNLNYQPAPDCPHCPPDSERSRYGHVSPNFQHQQQFADRKYNRQPTDMVSSEYYSPEIKTIRNTLLDIRDQMKYTNKNRNVREKEPHRGQQAAQTYEEANLRRNRAFERQLNSRLEEKSKRNRQLEIKIDQLQAAVEQLNIRNKELQDDKWRSQNKISEYEQQVQEQRARANRAENERIKVQERERALEIKIMELKADLMRREQVLRELNFNEQQQKQMQATKKLMMGKSDEVSVLVNWGKETYSRGCQTSLTEVDIQNGYRELNLMQDNLCDRINGNLKTEKQIFSRIQDIEEKMRFVHEVLYQVQEEASRLGIEVII